MSPLHTLFSNDYATARDRFTAAAARHGADTWRVPLHAGQPDGLAVDFARLGPPDAPHVTVVSSGLHGVEGYFGSAVQLALFERLQPTNANASLFMIHGLNPYGFAKQRRVDESNVDLNRNFLLGGEAYRGSHEVYRELAPFLDPPSAPRRGDFWWPAARELMRRDRSSLQQAIAEGQYDDPRGLFFGGKRAAPIQEVLKQALTGHLSSAESIIHIDLHSGLGRWATGRLWPAGEEVADLSHTTTPRYHAPLRRWIDAPRLGVYRARGSLGPWCAHHLPDADYQYFCAEFGTYSSVRVLAGLRYENRAHHYAAADSAAAERAARWLRELFCPASRRWRRRTVAAAMSMVAAAMRDR